MEGGYIKFLRKLEGSTMVLVESYILNYLIGIFNLCIPGMIMIESFSYSLCHIISWNHDEGNRMPRDWGVNMDPAIILFTRFKVIITEDWRGCRLKRFTWSIKEASCIISMRNSNFCPIDCDQRRIEHRYNKVLLIPILSSVWDRTVRKTIKESITPFPFTFSLDASYRLSPIVDK